MHYQIETYENDIRNMIIFVVCEFISNNKFTEPNFWFEIWDFFSNSPLRSVSLWIL